MLYFPDRAGVREWFERNHARASEVWIGYPKKGSPEKGVSYAEVLEEALCFGWIDGQVRSIDETHYANRYTPRKRDSAWSRTNVEKVSELKRNGRMHEAGLRVFHQRDPAQRAGYSFEERPRELAPELARKFRTSSAAWEFFRSEPPSYRRTAVFWVMSAKRPETRARRLKVLVDRSRDGLRIDLLSPSRPGVRPKRPRVERSTPA